MKETTVSANDDRPCLPCEVARAGGREDQGDGVGAAGFAHWVTRLVHEHRAYLARLARAEGLLSEDAFDAVQEAFHGFIVRPDAATLVREAQGSRRVLAAMTRNIARNRRRLHADARPHVSDNTVVHALPDGAPTSDQRLEALEQQQQLARCVSELVDAQRAVVTLRMLDEVPGEDVARMLGIAPGHVGVLLHRAKANLATCMAAAPDIETPKGNPS